MIRFVDLTEAYWLDGGSPLCAFLDTVTDRFLEQDGQHVFVDEVEVQDLGPELGPRCLGLLPAGFFEGRPAKPEVVSVSVAGLTRTLTLPPGVTCTQVNAVGRALDLNLSAQPTGVLPEVVVSYVGQATWGDLVRAVDLTAYGQGYRVESRTTSSGRWSAPVLCGWGNSDAALAALEAASKEFPSLGDAWRAAGVLVHTLHELCAGAQGP